MVALVLLGIVTGALYRALVTNQRAYDAQTQRIDLQQTGRAALAILPSELRELDAADGDILAMAPDSIRIRAMRQFAVVCRAPVLQPVPPFRANVIVPTTLTVRSEPSLSGGWRALDPARDDVLVYYEGDEASSRDDGWVTGDLAATAPEPCPDGRPGERLTAALAFGAGQLNRAGAIPVGAPLRGFELVTYVLYRAGDGRYHVGQRAGGSLQPIVGAVTADGLSLAYFDAAGDVTADPTRVATIEVRVRTEGARPVRGTGGGLATPIDSVVTSVALRNNRRF